MVKEVVLKPYELFSTGGLIEKLKYSVENPAPYWNPIRECLDHLLTLKNTRNFEFIGEQAESLRWQFGSKYYQQNAYLDSKDRDELKSVVSRWEGRLEEISKNWILSFPETHIDARKLVQGPMAFLSEEKLSILEPLEIYGLFEAASSLLFNNFISAEFVALRTAESLLKRWYEKRTEKKLGRTTWGQVLEKIGKEFPEEERPKELLLLDYLRERRNEIAHPEGMSGPEEASTTFFNVISLCKSLHLKRD